MFKVMIYYTFKEINRMGLFQKVFGTHSEHELKIVIPIVDKIESLRSIMQTLSDEQL